MKIDGSVNQGTIAPQYGFEDEVLDQRADLGWCFSCCMSISDEDEVKLLAPSGSRKITAGDDEILDRPLSAGHCGYTTNWPAPQRDPVLAQPAIGASAIEDEILDRTLRADQFTMCCCMGVTPEDEAKQHVAPVDANSFTRSGDTMVDTMLLAGASLLDDVTRPTLAS